MKIFEVKNFFLNFWIAFSQRIVDLSTWNFNHLLHYWSRFKVRQWNCDRYINIFVWKKKEKKFYYWNFLAFFFVKNIFLEFQLIKRNRKIIFRKLSAKELAAVFTWRHFFWSSIFQTYNYIIVMQWIERCISIIYFHWNNGLCSRFIM